MINFAFLYYSADGNYEVRYKSNVVIRSNGEVMWIPPAIYQVSFQHSNLSVSARARARLY